MRKILLISLMILLMLSSVTNGTMASYTITLEDLTADIYAKQFEFVATGTQNFTSEVLKIAPTETVPFVFQVSNYKDTIQSEVKMYATATITLTAAEGKSSIGNLAAKIYSLNYVNGEAVKTFLYDMNVTNGEGRGELTYFFPLDKTDKQFEIDVTWVSSDDDNDYAGDNFGNTVSVSATATQNNHSDELDSFLRLTPGSVSSVAPRKNLISLDSELIASDAQQIFETFQYFIARYCDKYALSLNFQALSDRIAFESFYSLASPQIVDFVLLSNGNTFANYTDEASGTSYSEANLQKAALAHRYTAELEGLNATYAALQNYFVKDGDTYTTTLTARGETYYAALEEAIINGTTSQLSDFMLFLKRNSDGKIVDTLGNSLYNNGAYLTAGSPALGAVYIKYSAPQAAALIFADGNILFAQSDNVSAAHYSKYYPQCYSGMY